ILHTMEESTATSPARMERKGAVGKPSGMIAAKYGRVLHARTPATAAATTGMRAIERGFVRCNSDGAEVFKVMSLTPELRGAAKRHPLERIVRLHLAQPRRNRCVQEQLKRRRRLPGSALCQCRLARLRRRRTSQR